MKSHGGGGKVSVMSPRNTRIIVIGLAAVLVLTAVYLLFVSGRSTGAEVTLEDGLKYTDITVGTGASPRLGGSVSVNYVGTLADGKEFNNTNGRPVSFNYNEGDLIRGWIEGMKTMKVGGKRRLTIPPELAYGASGKPPTIPPNSTLTFEISLLDVK